MGTRYYMGWAAPTGEDRQIALPPNTKNRYPGFEPGKKEKILTRMENSGSDAGGNRVAALEKKVNGVEALVREFTQELRISRPLQRRCPWKPKNAACRNSPVCRGQVPTCPAPLPLAGQPRSRRTAARLVRGAGLCRDTGPRTRDEPLMDMIMQTDGTMKPEIRRGSRNCIVAPVGYGTSGGGRNKKRNTRQARAEQAHLRI